MANVIRWMSPSKAATKIAANFDVEPVFRNSYTWEGKVAPGLLNSKAIDIYVVDLGYLNLEGINQILEWVYNGGNLLAGSQAWSWYYYTYKKKADSMNPDTNYVNGYVGNK